MSAKQKKENCYTWICPMYWIFLSNDMTKEKRKYNKETIHFCGTLKHDTPQRRSLNSNTCMKGVIGRPFIVYKLPNRPPLNSSWLLYEMSSFQYWCHPIYTDGWLGLIWTKKHHKQHWIEETLCSLHMLKATLAQDRCTILIRWTDRWHAGKCLSPYSGYKLR